MSGGRFDYIQSRLEWEIIIETLQDHINNNEHNFDQQTLEEFKNTIEYVKKMRIYVQRVDWLLSSDDGEKEFHEKLENDLGKLDI